MSTLYRGPSKDDSYQISIHLAKRLQRRRFFRNQPIRNKNCLWRPCLLTDRDEMSNLYRGHDIDASYQVSVHLAQWFSKFCIEMTAFWIQISIFKQELSFFSQKIFSIHLAKQFQRRRFKKISQSETTIAYGGHIC
jgi:hypothetical protein